jgi:hypothetical protein
MSRQPKKRGVYKDTKNPDSGGGGPSHDNLVDRVADFSYESDALAQLIVEMWLGQHGDLLLAPAETDYAARKNNAKAAFALKGVYLERPIVITEKEYEDGFSLEDAGLVDTVDGIKHNYGVVFVVPDKERATITMPALSLLESAKMLMAVTPNGI